MSENVTAQSLIEHFEYRLQANERGQRDTDVGEVPLYPMLVVFLGGSSGKGFMQVADHLFEIWPQYQKDIPFWCMEKPVSGEEIKEPIFEELLADGRKLLNKEEVQRTISNLFSPKNKFKNKQKVKIYYILNTSEIKDIKEYFRWIDAAAKSGRIFGLDSYEVSDILFLLLDESVGRGKNADAVKNALAACYEDKKQFPAESVFLLSNRRSGNDICGNWLEHYHMIASLITLSNNSGNPQVAAAFFSPTVKTISYAREEKPSEQIGQLVVTEVLDYLSENGGIGKKPVEETLLLERMGITKGGTVEVLDEYAAKEAVTMLPSENQMAFFPRKDRKETKTPKSMRSDEFNESTMNAWGCFLEKKAAALRKRLEEKSDNGKSGMEALLEDYKAFIDQNFSAGELCYCAEKAFAIKEIFEQQPRRPLQTGAILDAAVEQIKYLLSKEPEIREKFLGIFLIQCANAEGFLDSWDGLSETRREVFLQRDVTLEAFYKKKLRDYFDKNGMKLVKRFNSLRSGAELLTFLKETIDQIIEGDEVYSYSFERELATRLNGGERQDAANEYIRNKLITEDAHIYLRTGFAWPDPILSVVMLKKGISLHRFLQDSLGEDTYYYDTGFSKAAEAVKIYEIPQNRLITGGDL